MRPATGPADRRWQVALTALLLCLAWILFWYRDTAVAMVTIWYRSETFAHAFLVPPISFWLIWRERGALANMTPRASAWVSLLLALAGFGWLMGELAAVNALTQFSLVALLVLSVPAVLGVQVARVMMFPLAYLFFAVPVGEFVVPQMMEWTAEFTVRALVLTGVPVYREGLQFVIPSGNWSVVEACSGVRYLIASVVIGTLYAYLTYSSPIRRLIFIALSVVVPIIANWVRAYLIVMLGHLSGNKLAAGVDHLVYGWVFFGVVILLMFMIGGRWADRVDTVEAVRGPGTGSPAGASASGIWTAAVLVAVVTAIPHGWLRHIERAEAVRDSAPVSLMPTAPDGWRMADARAIAWRPAFTNPTAESQAEFVSGERRVGLYIGYYRRQEHDRKLVSSENVLVKSGDREWKQVAGGRRALAFGDVTVPVRTAEVSGAGGTRLAVWQWYWVNGRPTASDHLAKAWQALARLSGQGDDSAVVILYAPVEVAGDGDAALEAFMKSFGNGIEAALRRLR